MSNPSQQKHLFCFGLGFTGSALVREIQVQRLGSVGNLAVKIPTKKFGLDIGSSIASF